MDGWDDTATIMVGDRRVRVRRRRARHLNAWVVIAVLVVLAGGGVGAYLWLKRPAGTTTAQSNAVIAAGAFQAKIGDDHVVTMTLEIRNVGGAEVTVTGAQFVVPPGLTQVALTVLPLGGDNSNLGTLGGDFPPSSPVTLGTADADQNAVVAARFRVACDALPPVTAPSGEQIFVTVRSGQDERREELTPPVISGTPWLLATARSACAEPIDDSGPSTPLPPLP